MKVHPDQRFEDWVVDAVLSFGQPILARGHSSTDPDRRVVLSVTQQHRLSQTWQNREVRALKSFDHPAIPWVLDSGRVADQLFLALRPFSAHTLADRRLEGRLDWQLVCGWLFQVASALQHMHGLGWVHGDITPEHIFVGGPGEAWLMGMSSARRLEEPVVAPASELPDRNVTYMAPEDLSDPDAVTYRADLYAFGAVAYEILVGESAFPAAAWADRADRDQKLLEWKTRTKALDPGAEHPDWLRALIRKCTHPDPAQRLPDFDSVVAWLDASRSSWTVAAAPAHIPTPMFSVPREQLPPLQLQPSMLDTDQLARAIAKEAARIRVEQQGHPQAAVYVVMGAAAGLVWGLALSVLAIVYAELTWLA